MGQLLSEPIREKHSSYGQDERLLYGASGMQGWRNTMEDAHVTDLKVQGSLENSSLFAVFDGHAGDAVAKYCRDHIVRVLNAQIAKLKKTSDPPEEFSQGFVCKVLASTFLALDEEILADPELGTRSFLPGCTANVALINHLKNELFLANAGDSRAILSDCGVSVELSKDHKPTDQGEMDRIRAAGGFVEYGRVNGNLALSRAIGDFDYKKNTNVSAENQIVTANPDVIVRQLEKEKDEFMVLACDGIWDVLTNQQVTNFVRAGIQDGKTLNTICEELMETCMSSVGDPMSVGCDNMTVIIVAFLMGDSVDEWRKRCARKCPLADDEEHQIPSKNMGGPAAYGGTKKKAIVRTGVKYSDNEKDDNGDEEENLKVSQTAAEALLNAILNDQFSNNKNEASSEAPK